MTKEPFKPARLQERCSMRRVFLNPLLGEPVILMGFAISLVSVMSANPALNSLFVAVVGLELLDDRQITHLICVRLRHLLYDSFRGCFGPFI